MMLRRIRWQLSPVRATKLQAALESVSAVGTVVDTVVGTVVGTAVGTAAATVVVTAAATAMLRIEVAVLSQATVRIVATGAANAATSLTRRRYHTMGYNRAAMNVELVFTG